MDLFEHLTDRAWAAGIIDGEGSIGCFGGRLTGTPPKAKWAIKVSVSNTDPRMLLKLRTIFGVGSIGTNHSQKERERQTFDWTATSRKAVYVLEAIRPFLVIKGEQADIALAIAATMGHASSHSWTGTNWPKSGTGGRRLKPEVIAQRQAMASELRLLKTKEWTLEEAANG